MTPEPYFQDHDVTLHQGDVRDVLASMPPESVNCVVTSPPYFALRDYGVDGQIGSESSPGEYVDVMRDVFGHVRRVLAADGVLWLDLGDTYDAGGNYARSNPGTLKDGTGQGWNNSSGRTGGWLGAKQLMGMPWRVAFGLQDDGWILRNAVIWHKPNAMPESVTDRLSTRYEHVFLFSKARRYWFDLDAIREPIVSARAAALTWDRESAKEREMPNSRTQKRAGRTWKQRKAEGEPGRHGTAGQASVGKGGFVPDERGRNPGDVWPIPTQPFAGAHFATFPQALVRRCIIAGCPQDGAVLDPFAGSGTTLMVARQLGRKSIGIELNPDYCAIAVDRIGPSVLDFGVVS